MRRTVPLNQGGPVFHYKGEDNLKHLDKPAYERRSGLYAGQQEEKEQCEPVGEGDGAMSEAKIKRLQVDDLRERPERIRKDNTDTPAFLRKMMD